MPEDLPRLATFLHLNPEEVIQRYLMIDYYIQPDGSELDYLRPAKMKSEAPGTRASWGWAFHEADCIFLEDGRCSVYAARPWDCRMTLACDESASGYPMLGLTNGEDANRYLAQAWKNSPPPAWNKLKGGGHAKSL